MNLSDYLEDKRKTIDSFLKDYIAGKKKQKDCPRQLSEAMGYSLMAGGKRVRPVLCIAAYEAAGGKSDGILPVAASLELVHTYSLIHDDLPAMDNDDFRRNKPTNHKVFGEALAILAGDALLTDAFNLISNTNANPARLLQVIRELAHAGGPEGMVGGQTADIILEGKKAKKKDIVYIHTHKTGALIRGAVRTGAIMAGPAPDKLGSLTEYGEKTGLAFQIIDDILDITGTKEEMGKSTGADTARGKNTYPSALGLKKSEKIAEQLIHESLNALKEFSAKADPLREIAKYILLRRN
ncbi:MAG: polyprenyl synthetase family protein [Nitrospiraceae bacterium]|nr:MAG: polyprenyl synthetase family protein [Nitrospiraceae bacterium]